ncbi:AAA family ATPase [Desulfogranum marinum]|uniref:AAA family ATPase n=1 Tax=Desulfogranum marinum TaxID=453220 RepID=UPI0029C8F09B|nr:AAA family ATPase [Desulfogranum marinum]
MKILELRFKNLNSLYGEWLIDFTEPEYVSNGIFALTGPTGSGKSTILDAICLALYGATPRLGKITKSSNEIMSRQTGECYAEVVFESQAGRFLCHWEHRRARKKAVGALQFPEHQIADADTGNLLETKKSLVAGVIEEKTGMDFDRFTRSILLAQGGFDTFLKADAEQKSKILEQITGTVIYSEISRRVHERQREEREKLNLLQAETSGIVILEPEQETEIQKELEAKQKEETDLTGKSTKTGQAIAWLTGIDGLKKEIYSLSEETIKLQAALNTFKPERERLGRALKAAALDGTYATLTAIRKQQLDDQATLKIEEETLPELETSVKKQTESLKSTEQQTIKAKEELKAATPLIHKVRSLDQKLGDQKKAVLEGEASCKKDAAIIDSYKQTRDKEQKKRTTFGKNLELTGGYLKQYSQDEWLVSGLAGVEEQLGSLVFKQKEIAQKKADRKKAATALEQATKKLDDCAKQCSAQKQELVGTGKQLQQIEDTLSELLGDRLLREYRTEQETLLREMAFLAKITELEEHRAKLEDGKPCPLCGAKEHPFAEGNIPVPDETEKKIEALTKLISKAEDLEAALKTIEEAEGKARNNLTDSEKLEATAINNKKTAEKDLADLTNGLGKIQIEFTDLKQAVSAKLQPLGISKLPDSDISSLLESLRERLKTWQAKVKEKTEIEKQIADLDSELKRLDAIIETQGNTLSEKQRNLEALKKEYATGSDERKKLYGDKSPDDEELHLNKAITNAEESEKKARALHDELQQQLTSTKTNVESLKKRLGQRETELIKSETDFATALEPAGFSDEKKFLEARLTTGERDALNAKAKKLDDKQTDLKARQKDRETRLITEIAKKITDKTLEELEPHFKELEETLKQLLDSIAGLKHKLAENIAAKKRIKEKQTAIEAQKKECRRWEKLHGLIGSVDGKKYRNFAQGLTFELMVSHANRQLGKMTDRYLLIRDEKQPLELNVVDNYQAGEIRSTKNLSGGESFIVSLTLALGLSKMASRKVRVDSLFLDEGFGTLDDEALETALETLSGLQQDGKLIGIISHVSALKERISTQISIAPVSGGKSTITGPGCNKVAQRD